LRVKYYAEISIFDIPEVGGDGWSGGGECGEEDWGVADDALLIISTWSR
jgi:hypothetical protein